MKRVMLTILMLSICTLLHAEDRVKVQVQFRKLIFQCQDGTEEIVDASMSGGNTYEHTCKDGKWTNKFVNYSGSLSYTPDEYEAVKVDDVEKKKTDLVNDFIYQKNNPPAYVEPTEEEYKAMIDEKLKEIDIYSEKITDSTIIADIKAEYEDKISVIDSKVVAEEPIKEVVK